MSPKKREILPPPILQSFDTNKTYDVNNSYEEILDLKLKMEMSHENIYKTLEKLERHLSPSKVSKIQIVDHLDRSIDIESYNSNYQ